jgi:hypothetical protein
MFLNIENDSLKFALRNLWNYLICTVRRNYLYFFKSLSWTTKTNFPPVFSKTNKIAAKFKSLSAVQIKISNRKKLNKIQLFFALKNNFMKFCCIFLFSCFLFDSFIEFIIVFICPIIVSAISEFIWKKKYETKELFFETI